MEYEIRTTPEFDKMFDEIRDRRTQQAIVNKLEELKTEPQMRGKSLTGPLATFRSVRAARQRYRIIYHVDVDEIVVITVTVGQRKEGDRRDIYALTERLARYGLLKV